MGRDEVKLFHLDAIISSDKTAAELDEELKRLEEESKKLTEWPKM